MNKCHILIPRSCRSDWALVDPIIKRLEKEYDWICIDIIDLVPANYLRTYEKILDFVGQTIYDLVFIIGDRIEQMALCQWAFFERIPIIHYGGGITNTIATYDDILRHNITLMADIELCEDYNSANRVFYLWYQIKKIIPKMLVYGAEPLDKYNIHSVGNLYLDTINNIDESLVPKIPYDLVLYNPPTLLSKEEQIEEYNDLLLLLIERKVIYIGSNPDPSIVKHPFRIDYQNLPRPRYLGLLKNCKRFITNSSSSYYEAPYFLKPEQIIRIGSRNSNRSTDFNEMQKYPNCADNIIRIIKEWWLRNEEKKS